VKTELHAAAPGPSAADQARLAELEAELVTLRRMAERGRARQIAPLVAELERERALLVAPRWTPGDVDLEALRPRIAAYVLEMRAAFERAPEERRDAFRALLGNRKMRVFPDAERRFRVEGLFELSLESADARAVGHRASATAGSGGALWHVPADAADAAGCVRAAPAVIPTPCLGSEFPRAGSRSNPPIGRTYFAPLRQPAVEGIEYVGAIFNYNWKSKNLLIKILCCCKI
jgi:hypothetical protein